MLTALNLRLALSLPSLFLFGSDMSMGTDA